MSAELRNLARGFFADVNRNANDAGESGDKNEGDQPGRDVANAQGVVKTGQVIHGVIGVQKNFSDPGHHDENEDENVIPLQSPSYCLQFADFKRGQNQIFADEFLPFALQHLTIFHDHRDEKMRFEHANARAKGIIESISSRFDPEHHPHDREIEKENDVRDIAIGEGDGDDGGAARNGPIGRDVESLPPDHDPPELTAIKMRHGIDVTRIVNAALQRDRCFVGRPRRALFGCHGSCINWITASP